MKRIFVLLWLLLFVSLAPSVGTAQYDIDGDGLAELILRSRDSVTGRIAYSAVGLNGRILALSQDILVQDSDSFYMGHMTSKGSLDRLVLSPEPDTKKIFLRLYDDAGLVQGSRYLGDEPRLFVFQPENIGRRATDDIIVAAMRGKRVIWRVGLDAFEQDSGKFLRIPFGVRRNIPFLFRKRGRYPSLAVLDSRLKSAGPAFIKYRSVRSRRVRRMRIPRNVLAERPVAPLRMRKADAKSDSLLFVRNYPSATLVDILDRRGRLQSSRSFAENTRIITGRFATQDGTTGFLAIEPGAGEARLLSGGGARLPEQDIPVFNFDSQASTGVSQTVEIVNGVTTDATAKTSTPVPSPTVEGASTRIPSPVPSATATLILVTPTNAPTSTQTPLPSYTPTTTPAATATPTLLPTMPATPTATDTPTPTIAPTATPTLIAVNGYKSRLQKDGELRDMLFLDINGDSHKDIVLASKSGELTTYLSDGLGGYLTPTTVALGSEFENLESGLINNDIVPDLVLTDPTNDLSLVLINSGNGSFTSSASLSSDARSSATGDLNGDGVTDVVVTDNGNSRVRVFFGSGNGAFSSPVNITTQASPWVVELFDITGEGDLDMLVGADSGYVSVWVGNGDGTFGTRADYQISSGNPNNFAFGDLNGDTHIDVVTTDWALANAVIYLGDGSGSLSSTGTVSLGNNPWEVLLVRVNNDIHLDLVTVNRGSGTMTVAYGDGSGGFGTPQHTTVPCSNPRALKLGDRDGDTIEDLIIACEGSGHVFAMYGNGSGFESRYTLLTGSTSFDPDVMTVTDLNNDEVPDIVGGFNNNHQLGISLVSSSGTLGPLVRENTGGHFGLVAGDFNKDLNQDLAFTYHSNTSTVRLGNGAGTFGSDSSATIAVSNGNDSRSLVSGDFDNDTDLDLVIVNTGSDTITVSFNDGSANFSTVQTINVGDYPHEISAGFINDDNWLDLVVANRNDDTVTILLNSGFANGSFYQAPLVQPGTGSDPSQLAIADFTGDGVNDLLVALSAVDTIKLYIGDGTGQFSLHSSAVVGDNPVALKFADLDLDGDNDAVVANENSDTVSILTNNGSGIFSVSEYPTLDQPKDLGIADFNKDSRPDIAVAATGTWDGHEIILAY